MVPILRSLLICRHTVAREFRLGPLRYATRHSDCSVEHRFEGEERADPGTPGVSTPAARVGTPVGECTTIGPS